MTLRMNLVVLRASDPERLARFYEALGLSFATERHGGGPVHFASNLDGAVFEIYPRRPDEPATTAARLGFRTPALDEAVRRAAAADGLILKPAAQTARGRCALIQDPEGHKIELIEGA